MKDPALKIWERWRKVPLIVFCLSALIFLPRVFAPTQPTGTTATLKPLSLTGYKRLLVLAPHCDDETLGSAGLIKAAQRAGVQIQVVIATNGDGFFFATAEEFHKIYPTASDYIRIGKQRQQESLAAMKILGVQADQVTFLSYPDRGTPAEWNVNWSAAKPYRSPYSQDSKSPYPLTYDPAAVYAGEDYLRDLTTILDNYRPDLIVYPNPDDVHPDHWGLEVFARLAISEVQHTDATYKPVQLTYLVHRPDFPTVRGLKPQQKLVPPPALAALYPDWLSLDLPHTDLQLKAQAVQAYHSQLPLMHGLMESFIRSNELFEPVEDENLALASTGNPLDPSTWRDAHGLVIPPVERDPVEDFFVRKALPGADLVAAYLARDPSNDLWICSQTRDEISSGLTYQLRLKALLGTNFSTYQASTGKVGSGWVGATRSGVYTCAQTSLAKLGNPWAVFLGTDVEGGGRLMDQTGWKLIYVMPAP